MSVLLMSDLHLEFGNGAEALILPPAPDVDLIVFAGDIHIGVHALPWMAKFAEEREVIYVLGNHEFYQHHFPSTIDSLRNAATAYPNIHLLEQDTFTHRGVNYLGCTLWTDFNLFNSPEWSERECSRLADYHYIRVDDGLLRPEVIRRYHRDSLLWLKAELERLKSEPCVVVTHHVPVWDAIPARYRHDALTPAFASELSDLILQFNPRYWLCGHTHDRVDLRVGQTRILGAPMGYLFEQNYPGGYEGLVITDNFDD